MFVLSFFLCGLMLYCIYAFLLFALLFDVVRFDPAQSGVGEKKVWLHNVSVRYWHDLAE